MSQATTATADDGDSSPSRATADDVALAQSNNDGIDDNNYGPVTKLAHRAAAKSEAANAAERSQRIIKRKLQDQATAAMVGETALAILSTTSSGSGAAINNKGNMSVAARARMEADRHSSDKKSVGVMEVNSERSHPSSSLVGINRSGVSRGKFSVTQVRQMMDQWGQSESEEDEDEDDYEEYPIWEASHSPLQQQQQQKTQNYQHPFNAHYAQHQDSWIQHDPRHHGEYDSERERVQYGEDGDIDTRQYDDHKRGIGYNYPGNVESNEGGIFQSAKSWLQSQREKLARFELERQVEDQRRKLVEGARKRRAEEAEWKRRNAMMEISGGGGVNNDASCVGGGGGGHFSRLDHNSAASDGIGTDDRQGTNTSEDNPTFRASFVTGRICGIGSVSEIDESSSHTGLERVDSEGRIVEIFSSVSFVESDDDTEDGSGGGSCRNYMTVSSPKNTVSGNGMSVNVGMPDITTNGDIEKEEVDVVDHADSVLIDDVRIEPEPRDFDSPTISPPILTPHQMKSLMTSGGLPQSVNYCIWKRAYSLSRDGDSFQTFLHLVESHDRSVLAIRTARGDVFGGYAHSRWGACRFAHDFYGSAQACLFRFPFAATAGRAVSSLEGIETELDGGSNHIDADHNSNKAENEVLIYKWSGANRYIQLCDDSKRTIAFGGGGNEGEFGLCIEDDFKRGTTGHCATFENEALCEEGYFDIVDLEVWGFTMGF